MWKRALFADFWQVIWIRSTLLKHVTSASEARRALQQVTAHLQNGALTFYLFFPTLLRLGDLLADFADEAEGGRHAGHEGALGRPTRLTGGGDVIRV